MSFLWDYFLAVRDAWRRSNKRSADHRQHRKEADDNVEGKLGSRDSGQRFVAYSRRKVVRTVFGV